MKYYKILLWVFFALAGISLIVGIIAKISGFIIFGLDPLSYLRFTGICLLFNITLSLVQISLTKKE